MESELPQPGEAGSSPASVSSSCQQASSAGACTTPCPCLPSTAWDAGMSQLPSHVPLEQRVLIPQDGFDRSAGRGWQIWRSRWDRVWSLSFSAFLYCREESGLSSFVLSAVLRGDGLATRAGKVWRDSEGAKGGREREKLHSERRREAKRSRGVTGYQECKIEVAERGRGT